MVRRLVGGRPVGGTQMELRLLCGREGSGKSRRILQEIGQVAAAGRPAYFVVPQQFTFQAERDLMEILGLKGLMGIEVLSFERLAHKVFGVTGGQDEVFLDETGRLMVLRTILTRRKDELKAFRAAAGQSGFAGRCSEMVREMHQYGMTPEVLRARASDCGEALLAAKLEDCALILEDFEGFLAGRYIDPEGRLAALCRQIPDCEFLKDAYVFIDGLDSFTPLIESVVEALMRVCARVTATLAVDHERPCRDEGLFAVDRYYESRLREAAMRVGCKVVTVEVRPEAGALRARKAPELIHLEKELYAFPRRGYAGADTGAVRLFSGTGPQAEAEDAAREILRLARDEGMRYREMAVVCCDLEAYAPLLKTALERVDVPCFIDRKRPARDDAAAETVLQALRAADGRYRTLELMRLAKGGYAGLTGEQAEVLENYALFAGLQGSGWLKPLHYGEERFDLSALEAWRQKLVEPLEALHQGLRAAQNVEQQCRALFQYLEQIGLRQALEEEAADVGQDAAFAAAHAQVWALILDVLDQAVTLMGPERQSPRELLKMLESAMDGADIGVIPTAQDQVLVGSLTRSRSPELKALFLLGLNDEGGQDRLREEGLLHRGEADLLAAQGTVVARTSALRFGQQRFALYQVTARPLRHLSCSYAMSDSAGRPRSPAFLIAGLQEALPGLKTQSDIHPLLPAQLLSAPGEALYQLLPKLGEEARGAGMGAEYRAAEEYLQSQEAWRGRLMRAQALAGRRAFPQMLSGKALGVLGRAPYRMSVTRLEQFAQCPFKHLVRFGLGARPREEARVDAPGTGLLLHEGIEQLSRAALMGQWDFENLETEELEARSDALADNILPRYFAGKLGESGRGRYLSDRFKKTLRRSAGLLARQMRESGFELKHVELDFGGESQLPALKVPLPGGGEVWLFGRIDRIDVLHGPQGDSLRVIDYKSGQAAFSLRDVYFGLRIQLPAYLNAARNGLPGAHKRPAGMFYFALRDPQLSLEADDSLERQTLAAGRLQGLALNDPELLRAADHALEGMGESAIYPVRLKKDGDASGSALVTAEQFEAVLRRALRMAGTWAKGILEGDCRAYPVRSGAYTACMHCDYGAICGFDPRDARCRTRTLPDGTQAEALAAMEREWKEGK